MHWSFRGARRCDSLSTMRNLPRSRMLIVMLGMLAAGCSSDTDSSVSPTPYAVSPTAYAVLAAPSGDKGRAVEISFARRLGDGTVQVLVSGEACARLSGFTENSLETTVAVRAYIERTTDGPCTAQIVPWWVILETELSDDTVLVDGSDGRVIGRIDCETDPDIPMCGS